MTRRLVMSWMVLVASAVAWTATAGERVGSDLPEGIDSLIGDNLEVQRCLTDAVESGQELDGALRARLTIQADGFVTEASLVDEALRGSDLDQCVAHAIRSQSYPALASVADQTVEYDLVVVDAEDLGASADDDVDGELDIPVVSLPQAYEVVTPDAVMQLVENNAGIRACAATAHAAGEELPDKVWLDFQVLPDGTVGDAWLPDLGLKETPFAGCVTAVVLEGMFAPFAGDEPKLVHYPLMNL